MGNKYTWDEGDFEIEDAPEEMPPVVIDDDAGAVVVPQPDAERDARG